MPAEHQLRKPTESFEDEEALYQGRFAEIKAASRKLATLLLPKRTARDSAFLRRMESEAAAQR